ncbi:MAG: NAD-glutamate dehydrogenase, partial [Gammaproteobacteria bacterium]|nr:NAD-glutamate dehydrogenase [Gammaproteobacteria bacterium]
APAQTINLIRAWVAYSAQIHSGYPREHVLEWALDHLPLLRLLLALFDFKFNPDLLDREEQYGLNLQQQIDAQFNTIPSLSVDRALRSLYEIINATVRTNYYQLDRITNQPKNWISFKVNPKLLSDMKKPLMLFEIFVWHTICEGVHLRMSRIARGGIRWSDRIDDYRTEILGLAKTQHIKNTLIVPAGAKGGFIIHNASDRQDLKVATMAYQILISGILDLTDRSLDPSAAIDRTICYDTHDPYCVVAADKGTASFSDLANAISKSYGYWLGDAFASGGSHGYDHKKIGITAKGAFISAAHHMRNLGKDINQPFTAVGIGDLSGDVFGNGAILCPNMKLIAAFNHKHIFLDPNPLPQAFQERLRMVALEKSQWSDFNPECISPGGGVFSRFEKAIPVSEEMRLWLKIEDTHINPEELIQSLLKLPVDMIFNGGIGTYFKSAQQDHAVVFDKTNDSVRVDAEDLQCHMIIEGGNLGTTQAARIAFARAGKLINTDSLDNSGGVDCSDHEVNLKIIIDHLATQGIFQEDRDNFLKKCVTSIEKCVLQHNLEQNRAISLAQFAGKTQFLLQKDVFDDLVLRKVLSPELEGFQSHQQITKTSFFTRPELIVLLAYVKIELKKELLATPASDIFCTEQWVYKAFPRELTDKYKKAIMQHPLAKEIAITHLLNYWVHRVGITFAYRMKLETQKTLVEIIQASLLTMKLFNIDREIEKIEELDHTSSFDDRYFQILQFNRLIYRITRWIINNPEKGTQLSSDRDCKAFHHALDIYRNALIEKTQAQIHQSGSDQNPLSYKATDLIPALGLLFDVPQNDYSKLIEIFFKIREDLSLSKIDRWVESLPTPDGFSAQARAWLRDELLSDHQAIAKSMIDRNWHSYYEEQIKKWSELVKMIESKNDYNMSDIFVLSRNLQRFMKEIEVDQVVQMS